MMQIKQSIGAIVVGGAVSLFGFAAPALAEPPGFPDLDSFTAVDPGAYIHHGGRASGDSIGFTAPGGRYGCGFVLSGDAATRLNCSGDIPGVPEDQVPASNPPESCSIKRINWTGPGAPYAFGGFKGRCGEYQANAPVLPAGKKIQHGSITCAAEEGAIACLDTAGGNHGFVLREDGNSTVF